MNRVPDGKIVLTQLPDRTAFDFPSPLGLRSVRQFMRESGAIVSLVFGVVLSCVALGAAVFALVYVEFPEIAVILLFIAVAGVGVDVFLNEDAVFRVVTSFKLVFGGELARRSATRTRRLSVSAHMVLRTTWGGGTQAWNCDNIADIRAETLPTQDGVVMSIVLVDRCGLRFVLHSHTLSAFEFLPDRMEMAWIASRFREFLHLPTTHDLTPDPIPLPQPFAQAIREKTLRVATPSAAAAEPAQLFSNFRRVFPPPDRNNQT
jgi:hypothetical protein